MENKTQDPKIENESSSASSKKGCIYAILIFLGVVGIMVLIKVLIVD